MIFFLSKMLAVVSIHRGDENMQTNVNQPKISEETLKEMAKFFMQTSIPRILAEKEKENQVKGA
jgi:hypothetical protein